MEEEILPEEIQNLAPEETGSDQATCMMLAEVIYNATGEGFVLSTPGDFAKTAKLVKCPANCLTLTNGT